MERFHIVLVLTVTLEYHKVKSSRLSQLVAYLRIFRLFMKGKIWCLCTVTFGQKISKLNRRLIYCSRLYGIYYIHDQSIQHDNRLYTFWQICHQDWDYFKFVFSTNPKILEKEILNCTTTTLITKQLFWTIPKKQFTV